MTKIIKIDVAFATILLLIGTLFKLNHYPGANVLLIVGALSGIIPFVIIIATSINKLKSYETFNVLFSSLMLIVILLAFLFKMMHWAGAGKLIWIGDMGIILVCISFLVDTLLEKDKDRLYLKIISTFFVLLLGLVALYLRS